MGAKKKETKTFNSSQLSGGTKNQDIEKIFAPQTSKQTEVIEGDVDQVVNRIVDVLKSDIKVL